MRRRPRATEAQRKQRQLAWLLYISEGYWMNVQKAIDDLTPDTELPVIREMRRAQNLTALTCTYIRKEMNRV